jgi:hypothetical protein
MNEHLPLLAAELSAMAVVSMWCLWSSTQQSKLDKLPRSPPWRDYKDKRPAGYNDQQVGYNDWRGPVLRSEPTPTFSHTAPSIYTPTYKTTDTWDCITIVSDFPDVVPAHPLDILPCVAPEPVTIHSLMRHWPYTTHCFTEFRPRRTDGDPTELWLAPRGHFTHAHTLEHSTFCREHVCPTHFPYGSNKLAK